MARIWAAYFRCPVHSIGRLGLEEKVQKIPLLPFERFVSFRYVDHIHLEYVGVWPLISSSSAVRRQQTAGVDDGSRKVMNS
jgi:hypothetical protein